MTQTAMQILPAVDLSRWVPIDTAAPLLGLNRDHLGRMCKEKLQYQNDATFTATPENGQGKLANAFSVVRLGANAAAARDPNKRPLLEKKEQIEQAIEKLKFDKATIPAAQYKLQLTQLLLELAKLQEALDQ